jgi:membrane protease YdiL (CAAX protease family)
MLTFEERATPLRTAMWVGIYLVAQLAIKLAIISMVSHGEPANHQALSQMMSEMGPIGLLLLGAVIAPIMEETIFRFAVFNVVRIGASFVLRLVASVERAGAIGAWIGIVVSAYFFAAVHQETEFALFLSHFVMGIAAAHLYYKTGRFAAPVALHMANNGLAFIPMILG